MGCGCGTFSVRHHHADCHGLAQPGLNCFERRTVPLQHPREQEYALAERAPSRQPRHRYTAPLAACTARATRLAMAWPTYALCFSEHSLHLAGAPTASEHMAASMSDMHVPLGARQPGDLRPSDAVAGGAQHSRDNFRLALLGGLSVFMLGVLPPPPLLPQFL